MGHGTLEACVLLLNGGGTHGRSKMVTRMLLLLFCGCHWKSIYCENTFHLKRNNTPIHRISPGGANPTQLPVQGPCV